MTPSIKSTLGDNEFGDTWASLGTGWAASGDGKTITGTATTADAYTGDMGDMSNGDLYKVTFDAVKVSGNVYMSAGGAAAVHSINATGSYVLYLIAGSSNQRVNFDGGGAWTGTFTNITAKKVTNDLVGYWALDGDSTLPVLSFDGDDYVSCGNDSSITSVVSNLSVCCWYKTSADGGNIISRDDDTNRVFYMAVNSNDFRVSVWGANTSTAAVNTDTTITDGLWHHLAFTYESAKLNLYLDGVSDVTEATACTGNLVSNTEPLEFGRRGDGASFITGHIAQVVMYDATLSAGQIKAIYNKGIDGDHSSDDNLVGFWKCDSASSLTDLSSNSNTGTVNGASLVSNTVTLDSTSNNNDGGLV